MISRDPNKFVDEICEEIEVSSYDEEMTSGTPSRIDRDRARGTIEYHRIFLPRRTFLFINGRGMTFLSSISSRENPLLGESRKLGQMCRDITDLTEKRMERLIGTHCGQSYVVISGKKKTLGVSRIYNSWILYIEEASSRDFSIVSIRM